MRGNVLIKTLRLLNEEQRMGLLRFVKSPYFNSEVEKFGSPTEALCTLLLSSLPTNEEEVLDEESIYKTVFPGKPFINGKIDKVFSNLLKLVRHFLSIEYSDVKDEFNQSLALARFYRGKNWNDKFEIEVQRLKSYMSGILLKDESFYRKNFIVNQEQYFFENIKNQRKGGLNLPNVILSLDLFYIIAKYRYTVLLRQQQKYVEIYTLEHIELNREFRKKISQSLNKENILILIYEKLLQLVNNEIEDFLGLFNEIQKVLEDNADMVPASELKELQAYLRNYCTAKHNEGDSRFLSILFQLYQKHLEGGLIQEDGKIIASTITNIILVGLRLKKYEWVENFLYDFKGKINGTQFPDEVYNLNYANYYFHKREFDKAWTLLDWNFEDFYVKLAAKRIEVKLLFEQKESELLESKVNALKIFIFRADTKLISVKIKEMHNAFINYLSQIISPATLHNPDRIRKIHQKIIAQKAVAEREWLLEKIEELMKKK